VSDPAFDELLKEATEWVNQWPAWKRGILGSGKEMANLLPKQSPPVPRTIAGTWVAGRWVPWRDLSDDEKKRLWSYVRGGMRLVGGC
jgi:hypothetical protein